MVNYTRISVMSIGHDGGGGNFGNTLHRKMSENTIIAKKGVERPQHKVTVALPIRVYPLLLPPS